VIALALSLAMSATLDAAEEDALFSDSTVLEPPSAAAPASDSVKGTQVRLGGEMDVLGQGSWKRDPVFPGGGEGAVRLVGSANLDIRLAGGQRALAVFEVAHEGGPDTTSWALREMFLDADIGGRVWFRAGKQVLQWGRGILWTPTDLVNVEGRSLVERPGAREGATGLKVQVPFGTGASLVAFAPLRRVDASDSLSLSVRGEFLLGDAELAVSSWFKKDQPHVVGLDGSRRILGLDAQAGVLWLSGDLKPRAVLREGAWHLERDDERGQVRASGGLGRSFKAGGKPDRVRLDIEGFWQSEVGASEALVDRQQRPYADTIWRELDPRIREGINSLDLQGLDLAIPRGIPLGRGDGLTFLAGHGLFVPNQVASAYLGAMASVMDVFRPDVTVVVQALSNLDDLSGLGTFGVRWESLHGFHVQPIAYLFWGDEHEEFTLDGRGFALELRSGLRF
jgi:hypothetical protein